MFVTSDALGNVLNTAMQLAICLCVIAMNQNTAQYTAAASKYENYLCRHIDFLALALVSDAD